MYFSGQTSRLPSRLQKIKETNKIMEHSHLFYHKAKHQNPLDLLYG